MKFPKSLLVTFFFFLSVSTQQNKPRYHITPEHFWMNDPNAPIFYKNNYHMFFQHNPKETFWGKISWGHVYSSDLVHWKRLPVAMEPSESNNYDSFGVWSGSGLINENGEFMAFYTGVTQVNETFPFKEVQCIATSTDPLLRKLTKYSKNPILSQKPTGMETAFRDPFLFKEDGKWVMYLGGGFESTGGNVIVYQSADLFNWEFKGNLLNEKDSLRFKNETGVIWECPVALKLKNNQVALLISADKTLPHQSQWYAVGKMIGGKYVPTTMRLMDSGYLYAMNTFKHSNGNDILIGWIKECRPREEQVREGWSGSLSLPTSIDIGEDGYLQFSPLSELENLRNHLNTFNNVEFPEKTLLTPKGKFIEIYSTFLLNEQFSDEFGFYVRTSSDFKEFTKIYFDKLNHQIKIGRGFSSLSRTVENYDHVVDVPLMFTENQILELRIFIDSSVIEVFVNKKIRISTRIYPILTDSIGLYSYGNKGRMKVKILNIWEMNSIWNEIFDQSIYEFVAVSCISTVFMILFFGSIYIVSKLIIQ
jgi:beta-fructofuranosidase